MAIDSEQKRASATQFMMPYYPQHLVTDGLISGVDRQVVAWLYSGIAAQTARAYSTEVTVSELLIDSASVDELLVDSVSVNLRLIETGGTDEVI